MSPVRTFAAIVAACLLVVAPARAEAPDVRPPNVILILADDLGIGEIGCYGSTKIRTPHIDRLAAEGMRFMRHYSGSPVCAPTRCTLLTGRHTGHAFVRDNREMGGWNRGDPEGQLPLPEGADTLARRLQALGYATACIGKWGLGGPGSTGAPDRQGFDLFFGHLCQRIAHNHYPDHLWRNDELVPLPGNPWFAAHQRIAAEDAAQPDAFARFAGTQYAPELMCREALAFVEANRARPFFLYYASPISHAALQVPDEWTDAYPRDWDPQPYLGDKGYLPHPRPRAAYAGMVSHLDHEVGRILARVEALGLADDTVVIFTSDNGPTFNGGTDSAFFDSTLGRRGVKTQVFEGGIAAPLIVRWPGRVAAGSTSDLLSAHWDHMATILELVGGAIPDDIDGISFAPTLLGRGEQTVHDELYWEVGRQQAYRWGDWKLVRLWNTQAGEQRFLFDLARDPAETTNLAETQPDLVQELIAAATRARTVSAEFPSPHLEGTAP